MSYTNKWQLNSKQTKRRNYKAQSTLTFDYELVSTY